MSAFNTVTAEASCPYCSHKQTWTVQFKYGNCWQFEYKIGNKLRWGGNKKGQNVGGNVRTEGITEESCGKCGKNSIDCAVYLLFQCGYPWSLFDLNPLRHNPETRL